MANLGTLADTKTFEALPDFNIEWETDKAYLFVNKDDQKWKGWVPKEKVQTQPDGEVLVRKDVIRQKGLYPGALRESARAAVMAGKTSA